MEKYTLVYGVYVPRDMARAKNLPDSIGEFPPGSEAAAETGTGPSKTPMGYMPRYPIGQIDPNREPILGGCGIDDPNREEE